LQRKEGGEVASIERNISVCHKSEGPVEPVASGKKKSYPKKGTGAIPNPFLERIKEVVCLG